MKRCERCGRAVRGIHFSLPDCNETGFGVVLHRACARHEQTEALELGVRQALLYLDKPSKSKADAAKLRDDLRAALNRCGSWSTATVRGRVVIA